MFCTQCGNQCSANDRFCAQCGQSVAVEPSTSTSQPVSAPSRPAPSKPAQSHSSSSKTHSSAPQTPASTDKKISLEPLLQDPDAQAFVEPLQDMCNLIADRITDYLPFAYFGQFLSFIDLVTEVGQGFESGELDQTDFFNVYGSVMETGNFTEAMASYRQALNDFPLSMAEQYNYLLESLVNNGVDDSIMQYALNDRQLKVEADKLQAALAKPAAESAAALKSVVAAYPNVAKLLQKANADFNALKASEETMEDSEFWSYAQGFVAFAANPAFGAMSLMRAFSRSAQKNHRNQDRVSNELIAFSESVAAYTETLFSTFDQLHHTAQNQCTGFSQALLTLYAKPFLLARHIGAIDDWETLGEGATALVGEGIYGGLIEDDDEVFDEIIGRSRELVEAIRDEAE